MHLQPCCVGRHRRDAGAGRVSTQWATFSGALTAAEGWRHGSSQGEGASRIGTGCVSLACLSSHVAPCVLRLVCVPMHLGGSLCFCETVSSWGFRRPCIPGGGHIFRVRGAPPHPVHPAVLFLLQPPGAWCACWAVGTGSALAGTAGLSSHLVGGHRGGQTQSQVLLPPGDAAAGEAAAVGLGCPDTAAAPHSRAHGHCGVQAGNSCCLCGVPVWPLLALLAQAL